MNCHFSWKKSGNYYSNTVCDSKRFMNEWGGVLGGVNACCFLQSDGRRGGCC